MPHILLSHNLIETVMSYGYLKIAIVNVQNDLDALMESVGSDTIVNVQNDLNALMESVGSDAIANTWNDLNALMESVGSNAIANI